MCGFRTTDDETYALKGVSLTIQEGERIGIVGLTGSGKTSLINLLLGFYRPTRGEILPGRTTPRRLYSGSDSTGLRHRLTGCFYLSPLHQGKSVRGSGEGARSCRGPAHARAFQVTAPRREIAEDGLNLSEGEKQLIAIGRVIAYRPRYVILDEATSRIDRYLEERVKSDHGRRILHRPRGSS